MTRMMQALAGDELGGPLSFRVRDMPKPEPGPGEVRVRIRATGLGYVDGLMVAGRYQIRPPCPYVPGCEIAGEIDALGPGVSGLATGDRVVTWQIGGGLADYIVVDSGHVDHIPDGLDYADAAGMLIDYQTAAYALFERGGLKAGETVLVLGAAGGVGMAAIQIARAAGASVIAASSTEAKRQLARDLGASTALDSRDPAIRDRLREVAPAGPDIVVDTVGGDLFEPMFRSLGKEGRHLVIGFASGAIGKLPANLALLKSAALIGVDFRHYSDARSEAAHRRRVELFGQVASGDIQPPRLLTYPLTRGAEALAAVSDRNKTGKVVVVT